MSAAQPAAASSAPAAAAAAASSRAPFKKRPRHFWEGPDPADDSDEEKQGTEHVSPVARLYRHALESVFGFLKLADLSRMLAVCRSWSASVRSMKSLDAAVVDPTDCWRIAASPLARHVSEIGGFDDDGWSDKADLKGCDLFILSRHLPWLTSLSCDVAPHAGLLFGLSLQTLNLRLSGSVAEDLDAAAINDAIVIISRLPQLTDLTLELAGFYPALVFAPLASAVQLRDLELVTVSWSQLRQPTPQHLDQLRTMPQLRKMALPKLSAANLALLLRAPHLLQWQEIHMVEEIGDAAAALFSTLPTLTKLHTTRCRNVAFLPSLTRLRTLDLRMADSVRLAAAIIAGLSCCSQLTDLSLAANDVTSTHMSQIVSHLPLLSSLTLRECSSLESLSFLSACRHLAQSLESLHLWQCRNTALHSTELKHVLTLKTLTSLDLSHAFVEPLDECTQHLLIPPSVVLSNLEKFEYEHES